MFWGDGGAAAHSVRAIAAIARAAAYEAGPDESRAEPSRPGYVCICPPPRLIWKIRRPVNWAGDKNTPGMIGDTRSVWHRES